MVTISKFQTNVNYLSLVKVSSSRSESVARSERFLECSQMIVHFKHFIGELLLTAFLGWRWF